MLRGHRQNRYRPARSKPSRSVALGQPAHKPCWGGYSFRVRSSMKTDQPGVHKARANVLRCSGEIRNMLIYRHCRGGNAGISACCGSRQNTLKHSPSLCGRQVDPSSYLIELGKNTHPSTVCALAAPKPRFSRACSWPGGIGFVDDHGALNGLRKSCGARNNSAVSDRSVIVFFSVFFTAKENFSGSFQKSPRLKLTGQARVGAAAMLYTAIIPFSMWSSTWQ